ncbi:MAG: heat shock protein GrpE [candidate division BRC1 bacterium ADurb.BinA364]|nr:MAG: heat shock protein GrpE [candidate division BRC1 bacterium ADurb.BinA364]
MDNCSDSSSEDRRAGALPRQRTGAAAYEALGPNAAPGAPPARSVAELEAKLEAARDERLRALAEVDNMRKRARRDMEQFRESEREALLAPWLEVVDSAERALAAHRRPNADAGGWAEGFEAILRQMRKTLKDQGVEPIEALGRPFDPHFHEAVSTTAAPGRPDGWIVEETQKGYMMGAKMLRPAKVIVVKNA